MQKLIYYVATSLDGYIAREDGSFSDFPMDDEIIAQMMQMLDWFGSVLMGRKTYEVGLAAGKPDPYPMLKSYVFSSSLNPDAHPEVTVIPDKLETSVRRIKEAAEKPVWLCGGGELAGKLYDLNLIDELWIKLNPIVLGKGISLFGERSVKGHFQLKEQQVLKSGIIVLKYETTQ